jgi:hypothetical protein
MARYLTNILFFALAALLLYVDLAEGADNQEWKGEIDQGDTIYVMKCGKKLVARAHDSGVYIKGQKYALMTVDDLEETDFRIQIVKAGNRYLPAIKLDGTILYLNMDGKRLAFTENVPNTSLDFGGKGYSVIDNDGDYYPYVRSMETSDIELESD